MQYAYIVIIPHMGQFTGGEYQARIIYNHINTKIESLTAKQED